MTQNQLLIVQLLLAKAHDLAGLAALALGLFAMAAPKQGIGHSRSGRFAMIAMGILIALALVLLLTYLLPDNPSRGQGPQLLFYLLVVAWMATYSLLAAYRWASSRRGCDPRMGHLSIGSGRFGSAVVVWGAGLGSCSATQLFPWLDGGSLRFRADIRDKRRSLLLVCR
jgi:hypothetical protein